MPWPDVTVPKFGNWDENGDYSIVFDKARADKERFFPTYKEDHKDASIHQQHKVDVPDPTAARVLHQASLHNNKTRTTTEHGYNAVDMPSGGKTILGDHHRTNNIHGNHWPSLGIGSTYNNNIPIPSLDQQQPRTRGIHHTKPAILFGTGRQHFVDGIPPSAKISRSQRSNDGSGRASDPVPFQPEKGSVLPKFGDWDASNATSGEGFTVIFNRARDEKKSQFTPESTSKPVSPLRGQGDEDLYQNRRSPNVKKKGKGWFNTFCCIDPTQL